MSPRFRTGLHAQAGAVFSFHPRLYAGDRPTAGRSRSATILPGDAAVSPSNGDHAGTLRADPTPPRDSPKHRGAGRSRSATAPPCQSRSTRQFLCAEELVGAIIRIVAGMVGITLVRRIISCRRIPIARWVVVGVAVVPVGGIAVVIRRSERTAEREGTQPECD